MGISNGPKRRTVLKSFGIAGGGVSGIPLTASRTEGVERVEIVTGKRGDEPVATQSVPREWYRNVLRTREVQTKLIEELSNNIKLKKHIIGSNPEGSGSELINTVTVRRVSSDEKIGELQKRKIEVPARDVKELNEIIPDSIDSIPIEVVEKPPADHVHIDDHDGGDWCEDQTVNCIQGGNMISCRYANGETGCEDEWGHLTITCGVKQDGDTCIMTSAHGFTYSENGVCNVDIANEVAKQGNRCYSDETASYIGLVKDYSHGLDFATINATYSTNDVGSGVVSNTLSFEGHVTEDGLDYMDGHAEEVFKYGARTCHDSGIVTGVDYDTRCGEVFKWVKVSTQAASGDSGAPHYAREGPGTGHFNLLLGPHTRHEGYFKDNGEYVHVSSYAPAAFEIAEKHGVVFSVNGC